MAPWLLDLLKQSYKTLLKLTYKALLKPSYMALELHGSLATWPFETELHDSLKLSYMAPKLQGSSATWPSKTELSCKALLKLNCKALLKLSYMAPCLLGLLKLSCKALLKLSCKALLKLSYMAPELYGSLAWLVSPSPSVSRGAFWCCRSSCGCCICLVSSSKSLSKRWLVRRSASTSSVLACRVLRASLAGQLSRSSCWSYVPEGLA